MNSISTLKMESLKFNNFIGTHDEMNQNLDVIPTDEWVLYQDSEGCNYYYNHITGESTYEIPEYSEDLNGQYLIDANTGDDFETDK